MSESSVKYIKCAKLSYISLEIKNDNTLYFITDTNEIYKGDMSYTRAIVPFTGTLPSSPDDYRIYLNTDTLVYSMWNGVQWITINSSSTNIEIYANW